MFCKHGHLPQNAPDESGRFCACWGGIPKPLYGLKTAKNKDNYRYQHESAFIIHEAAAKALRQQAGDGGKLPNPANLKAEYTRLTEKKNALRVEYDKLKQQAQQYNTVKKNVDSILNPAPERVRGRDRSAEL